MIIDGKIENLVPEAGDHLLNIRVLSTLLGYIQGFCVGRDILHLSMNLTFPANLAWIKPFLNLAGFQRCQCLKPELEEESKGRRVCLKLDKSRTSASEPIPKATTNGVEENSGVTDKVPSASTSLTIKGTHSMKQSKPDDRATQWLSQNQQILKPATSSTVPNPRESNIKESRNDKAVDSGAVDRNGRVSPTLHRNGKRRLDHEDNGVEASSTHRTKTDEGNGEKRFKLEPNASEPSTAKKSGLITDDLLTSLEKSTRNRQESGASGYDNATTKQEPRDPAYTSSDSYKNFPGATLPAKSLTCFYWGTQGSCKFSDNDCLHAHYHTGKVARAPPSSRYARGASYYSSRNDYGSLDYGGDDEYYSSGYGATPSAPKALLDDGTGEHSSDKYNKYRPRSDSKSRM